MNTCRQGINLIAISDQHSGQLPYQGAVSGTRSCYHWAARCVAVVDIWPRSGAGWMGSTPALLFPRRLAVIRLRIVPFADDCDRRAGVMARGLARFPGHFISAALAGGVDHTLNVVERPAIFGALAARSHRHILRQSPLSREVFRPSCCFATTKRSSDVWVLRQGIPVSPCPLRLFSLGYRPIPGDRRSELLGPLSRTSVPPRSR